MIDCDATVENIDETTKQINVKLPYQEVETRAGKKLAKVAQTAKFKGFRKGKVPLNLVQKVHGPQVEAEALQDVINESLFSALEKNSFPFVGRPEVTVEKAAPEDGIEYFARLNIIPDFEVQGLESLQVTVADNSVSDSDIDKVIQELRNSQGTLEDIEGRDIVENGDMVTCVMHPLIDGEVREVTEPVQFLVGDGKVPAGLEESVLGKKIGEKWETTVDLNKEDTEERNEELVLQYKLELKELKQFVLPEVNDEFAAKTPFSVETVDEVKEKIREFLERQAEDSSAREKEEAVIKALVESNEFSIPDILVEREMHNLYHEMTRKGCEDGHDVCIEDFPEDMREKVQEVSVYRAKASVLIEKIAEEQGLEPDLEEKNELLKTIFANSMPGNEEANQMSFDALGDDSPVKNYIEQEARKAKAVKYVISKAHVEYKQADDETEE